VIWVTFCRNISSCILDLFWEILEELLFVVWCWLLIPCSWEWHGQSSRESRWYSQKVIFVCTIVRWVVKARPTSSLTVGAGKIWPACNLSEYQSVVYLVKSDKQKRFLSDNSYWVAFAPFSSTVNNKWMHVQFRLTTIAYSVHTLVLTKANRMSFTSTYNIQTTSLAN